MWQKERKAYFEYLRNRFVMQPKYANLQLSKAWLRPVTLSFCAQSTYQWLWPMRCLKV